MTPSSAPVWDRVVITGGAGFVGSHLADALAEAGTAVTLIDDLSTGSVDNVSNLVELPAVRLVVQDVADEDRLDPLVAGCDLLIHLAAVVGVELVTRHPVATIRANVAGTEAVLGSASRHGVKVLVASTSEVYGKGSRLPFGEDDDLLLGPTSRSRWCYAASKMVDEFLTLGYAAEHGLGATVFRLFNTVGPRQTGRYGMVIPRFVNAALTGGELEVYGDGTQTRSFLHVADAVEAILALAVSPDAAGQVFNVGSTHSVTILELAEAVREKVEARTGTSAGRIVFRAREDVLGPGFEDIQHRLPDISKIRRVTGWEPIRSLDDILDEVVMSTAAEPNLAYVTDESRRPAAAGTSRERRE